MSTPQTKRQREYETKFICKHCHQSFVHEKRYLEHKCKQMKRIEELQSLEGQTAWNLYQIWLRAQNRMPPPIKSFLTSKYYRTFINFAHFSRKVQLPFPERFIKFMCDRGLPPTLWVHDEVYMSYLDHIDSKVSPLEHLKMSIETLLVKSENVDVDISDIFNYISMSEIISLIRKRRLSPWFLLFSKKFKQKFKETATTEEKIILDTLIKADVWAEKIHEHQSETEIIKQYINGLNV